GGGGGPPPGAGVPSAAGQRDAERPRHTERGRTPYGEPAEGADQLVRGVDAERHELVGQPGLVDELDRAVHPVDGPHAWNASAAPPEGTRSRANTRYIPADQNDR